MLFQVMPECLVMSGCVSIVQARSDYVRLCQVQVIPG